MSVGSDRLLDVSSWRWCINVILDGANPQSLPVKWMIENSGFSYYLSNQLKLSL